MDTDGITWRKSTYSAYAEACTVNELIRDMSYRWVAPDDHKANREPVAKV